MTKIERWRAAVKERPALRRLIKTVVFLAIIAGVGKFAFSTYDFTQNNPAFCNKCHIMNEAFTSWQKSVHRDINCHECHRLNPSDLNTLLVSAFINRIEKVPVHYDRILVPWKTCMGCHWQQSEEYPQATKINDSRLHAKHYFIEKIECAECHGYNLHEFLPEERFCTRCHERKDTHESMMSHLPCLNCHTDRTKDLFPERGKCLICHAKDPEGLPPDISTIDVAYFIPSEETINRAPKIEVPANAPMKFRCNKCHIPHDKIRPDYGTCMNCHPDQLRVGVHALHVSGAELECTYCHKPHSWIVGEKEAVELCSECHDYTSPHEFIGKKVRE
jgi:cytochrome c nitrite reductase small subunit